jgi:hypothetical protein
MLLGVRISGLCYLEASFLISIGDSSKMLLVSPQLRAFKDYGVC